MKLEIKEKFKTVFNILLQNKKIVIPEDVIIKSWQVVIEEWIKDESMTLFVRKGGEIRGTKITNIRERDIITTDNTPAHWVFKNLVLDKLNYNKNQIADLVKSNRFPISFVRKKSEYETLIGEMVATKTTRLNEHGWKLAHIDRIAMKRGNNITIEDYKTHHSNFLNLSNMYLIDKDFSGLAEVLLFNEIVQEYKNSFHNKS